MQKTILKQNYENFAASSQEGLDKTYDSTNETVNTAHSDSAASSKDQASTASYAGDVMFSFYTNQSNASQLDNEDLEQIDANDLEEMDLKWQVTMLTMRVKRFIKKIRRKLDLNGKEIVGFDTTKVECYNCHSRGHFARECRAPINQGNRNIDAPRRNAPEDTSTTNALVVQDGIGGYDWSFQAEEGITNFARMAYTSQGSLSSDSEVHTFSKECLKSYEALQKQYDQQREALNKTNLEITVKEKMESQSETTQTVSALKLPVLKTEEYNLWSIRMEQYLTFTDHALWEEDANLKLLRNLPSAWNNIALIMRNKSDLHALTMDDLYNNLKMYESDIKGHSSSSSNSQNVAFVSSDDSSSTNETVNTAHSVSVASSKDQASTASYAGDVMFSFYTNQSNASQLDNEDLEQIDANDLEEIDLKWQVTMLTMRVKRFVKKIRRKLDLNGKEIVGFDTTKVECYNCHSREKTGLGYDGQMNESDLNDIHVNESEVLDNVFDSVFDSRESDGDDNQVNDKFKKGERYHVVLPPHTRNYMPSRADLSFVGAATTATSLEAEQESGNIIKIRSMTTLNEPYPQGTGLGSGPRCQDTTLRDADVQTSMEHQDDLTHFVPPTPCDSPFSRGYTPESDEDCSRLGDQKAAKESQRLKKKQRASTSGMNLFKIGTSMRQSLDKKNVSKQGRNLKTRPMFEEGDFFDDDFDDINDTVDEVIENVEGDTVNVGGAVNTATTRVSAASASVTTTGVSISTAEPRTPLTTTTTAFEDEDLTFD
nr:hypothetical protein [Tanacetum cinerariifolium]